MPEEPIVSVFPPELVMMVTGEAGLRIRIPAQLVLAPSTLVVLLAETVPSHTATSVLVGVAPPTQELGKLRLSALSALETLAACSCKGSKLRSTRPRALSFNWKMDFSMGVS